MSLRHIKNKNHSQDLNSVDEKKLNSGGMETLFSTIEKILKNTSHHHHHHRCHHQDLCPWFLFTNTSYQTNVGTMAVKAKIAL